MDLDRAPGGRTVIDSPDSAVLPGPGFLFGVATADHQCEAFDPAWPEDVRDIWECDMHLVGRGPATDFWNRYDEDVQRAKELGCRAFRFSIAWSRVEPQENVYSNDAWNHYSQIVDSIIKAELVPVVTLHHYTWPLHVDSRGGLTGPAFPAIFAGYAAEAARRLGDRVKYWLTFNEPNMLIYGYLKLWWQGEYKMPPGLPADTSVPDQVRQVRLLMKNLFLANAQARAAIKNEHANALVSTNPLLLGLPGWLQWFLDFQATHLGSEASWERLGKRMTQRRLASGGRVDLVAAAMSVTTDRGTAVDFSRVYSDSSIRLLTLAGHPGEPPAGNVVVVAGSTAERIAPEVLPAAKIRALPDYNTALAAVASGAADGLLGDDAILKGLTRGTDIYGFAGPELRPERHAVAVAKNDEDLLAVVNSVIDARQPPAAVASVTAAAGPPKGRAIARIRKRGHLIAGVLADVPGLGFRNPQTGEWSGDEIDLCRSIAGSIFGDPARVVFVPVTTRTKVSNLSSSNRFLNPFLRWWSLLLCAFNGNWWHLGMAGRLPTAICPEGCAGQQDFVALDYYWGVSSLSISRLHQLAQASVGHYADAPVCPSALTKMLHRLSRWFPGCSVIIAENGCVEAAGGLDRADYVRRHLNEVSKAIKKGVPVIAYLCWSLTSNREWGLPFGPASDFGLYRIELDTDPALTRTKQPAALAYEAIISGPWPQAPGPSAGRQCGEALLASKPPPRGGDPP